MATRRKVVRSTNAQLRLLVDHMCANKLFALGEFTGPLGSYKIEAEWIKLRDFLAEHGPPKTVNQWKHTWRDLKKKAREEGAKARVAFGVTGNHILIPEVSEISKKILDIIGKESAQGLSVEGESQIGDLIVLPDSDFPWTSPSPDAYADSNDSLTGLGSLFVPDPTPRPAPGPSPRSAPGPSPRSAPGPSPRPTPDILARPALGPSPRSASGPSPRSAPGPSPRPTPDILVHSGSGPSQRPAPSLLVYSAPGLSPRPAPGSSLRPTPGPSSRSTVGPSPCPTSSPSTRPAVATPRPVPRPTPQAPVARPPGGTPIAQAQQMPARARPRRRPARALESASRPTTQFIAGQKQEIRHLQELVEEQRTRNFLLRMKLKRRRLATALYNLRFI